MGIIVEGGREREIIVGRRCLGNLVLVIVLMFVQGICERNVGENWEKYINNYSMQKERRDLSQFLLNLAFCSTKHST